MVTPGVRDNKEAWFTEGLLDLIGEGTGSEPTSDGMSSSVMSKLKDGTLREGEEYYHT